MSVVQQANTTYSQSRSPNRNNRAFELKKMEIELVNEEVFDIQDLVVDFEYHESIESSFLRCDFSILDSIDFNANLQGGEKITIQMATESSLDHGSLDTTLQVYKIGSIIKSERGQMYILHCVSPEMYHDEMTKILKAFGPGKGGKDVENVPKHICKEYLKADDKINSDNFENHSKITFVSANWKPSDAIQYMTDKVTRLTGSKTSMKQSGFLFFENRNGFNFKSIDSICDGQATKTQFTYTYVQPGTDPPDGGKYVIESIQYPDKANHLSNMRRGTYKSAAIGISLPAQKDSFAPTSGKKKSGGGDDKSDKKGAPGGTVHQAMEITMPGIFNKATTVEQGMPFKTPEFLKQAQPTRMKIRALPGLKNQTGVNNPNNGTNPDHDTMAVAQYAAGRYNLFKAIQLRIVVPGNTALAAGSLIKVVIPGSIEKGKNLKHDKRFSGKYVIAALTHTYQRQGITTNLLLVRDSVPEQQ